MNSHFLRGQLLLQQERYEHAAEEFQKALAEEPDNGFFHAMLANALLHRGHWQNALESAQTALSKDPDSAFSHWTMALIWLERDGFKEAEAAIGRAIELDPEDADYPGLLARILSERGQHEAALEAANRGLALDAKNDLCLTFRSRALMALGRTDEARHDADVLLADAPHDAWNHCLRGDQLLADGDQAKAREHYIEALRIDPRNAGARHGLATSLKARSPLYSALLLVLLRLDRWRGWSIWIVVLIILFGMRVGDAWARQNPEWLVAYEAVKALLWAAVVLIVLANPIFDLLLRFDRDGRHALTDDEVKASNWHLVCIAFAALCGAWALAGKSSQLPRTLGFTALFFTRAITEVFEATPGYVRRRMAAMAIVAAVTLILTPFVLVAGVIVLVKTKRAEFAKPLLIGALWIPVAVIFFSAFADKIRNWLEKRRPDTI